MIHIKRKFTFINTVTSDENEVIKEAKEILDVEIASILLVEKSQNSKLIFFIINNISRIRDAGLLSEVELLGGATKSDK